MKITIEVNNYCELEKKLKELQCEYCGGIGQQNDLEPGDIGGKYWKCEDCNGSGILDKSSKNKQKE